MNRQCKSVIAYIKKHGKISTLKAASDVGVASLQKILFLCRKAGYEFSKTTAYTDTSHYYEYRITKRPRGKK